jgi:hypothetical protein
VLAARALRACDTQWRYAAMGGATGLDAAACAALITHLLPKWQRELEDNGLGVELDMRYDVADALEDLHVLELATLEAWAELRAAEKDA